MVSQPELVAHVLRRLSMGVQPDASFATPDEAIAAALDLSAPAPAAPALEPATDEESATDYARLGEPLQWWTEQMIASPRPLEERLVWFWTDHFATGLQKVRSVDLMWLQHATIRRHACGSFAELLHAMAVDGAMLVYLDGVQNAASQPNENYAREVMELHALGRGHYTQDDVVAAARAFTGWVVHLPFRPRTVRADVAPYASYFVPARHDSGVKTFLGVTGELDLADAIDVLLEQEQTARFVGGKLYRAIVGRDPGAGALDRLSSAFRRDWSILALVEAIVSDPAFLADDAVRLVVRTPLEKLVGLAQAVGARAVDVATASAVLRAVAFVPFAPPNPAGYPSGRTLLGPHQLVHTFDLLDAVAGNVAGAGREVLARFGVFDASAETLAAVDAGTDARERTLLALGSPEYALR